ncbi:hypothetical protein GCM10023166_31030 [Paeniglutamicibacter cryotolerans]
MFGPAAAALASPAIIGRSTRCPGDPGVPQGTGTEQQPRAIGEMHAPAAARPAFPPPWTDGRGADLAQAGSPGDPSAVVSGQVGARLTEYEQAHDRSGAHTAQLSSWHT